jgi:cysteine desulfuration protein SufE
MSESVNAAIDRIAEDFALFSDWEERYAHVLDMAKSLPPLSPEERTDANKVRGCASQVWLVTETHADEPQKLFFRGESDAHLVRGLIAILLSIFSGRSPAEILSVDPKDVFTRLQLKDALTQQRSNGLFAMMERIRRDAASAAGQTA